LEPASFETGSQPGESARYRDRRLDERFELNGAFGNVIYKGALLPCQFIDISMGGCCVRMESPFADGALAPVEIVLLIFGLALRIGGITQWTARGNLLGIRFAHPSAHSKNQLAGLLTCLIDQSAAEAVKEAIVNADLGVPGAPILSAQAPAAFAPDAQSAVETGERIEKSRASRVSGEPVSKPQLPIEEEWPVVIRFLETRSHAQGLILDLRLDGCTVKMAEEYPGRLQGHVELSFHARGLPFQLAGITAAFLGRNTAAVRFQEMSRRRREELGQVLEELLEAKKKAAK
jgi:PilZ domain